MQEDNIGRVIVNDFRALEVFYDEILAQVRDYYLRPISALDPRIFLQNNAVFVLRFQKPMIDGSTHLQEVWINATDFHMYLLVQPHDESKRLLVQNLQKRVVNALINKYKAGGEPVPIPIL